MALLDIQRRLAEIGRIRIGEQVPIGKSGKTRPAKLDTFRLTSPNKTLIDAAANLYGGTAQPWTAPAGPQFEVITETAALPVIVPPGDVGFSQHYELWSGGGCLRRCDGDYATYSAAGDPPTLEQGECLCDPEGRECKPHSRLSVMLRDLPGIGLWRLDTQGFYAAAELKGAVEILEQTRHLGILIPARLTLRQEVIKRPGKPTRRFAVPWLDVEITPGQLAAGITTPPNGAAPAIDGAPRAIDATNRFTPVPTEDTPPEDIPTIAEQAAARTPRRKGGQAPIARTGITPRTTSQTPTNSTPTGTGQPAAIPNGPGRRRPSGDTIEALEGQIVENARRKPSKRAPRTPADAIYDHDDRLAAQQAAKIAEAAADNPDPASPGELGYDTPDPPDYPGPRADNNPEPRMITKEQMTLLAIKLREAGMDGNTDDDRQARRDFCAEVIGRTIGHPDELTLDEARKIIDVLVYEPPEPPGNGD